MGVNTKYKDSMFSFLFSNPDTLRELYCALEDINLSVDVPVNINTLRDVLFMDMVNDISFEIGGKLVILIEHQSTINPNMALRLLMYIARVYEKLIGDKKIYSTQKILIPRPEFFVLYNGKTPYPDESVMKLSEMFESVAELGLPEGSPALELNLRVININEGRNEKIAKRCKTLAGYSAFIAKARAYEEGGADRGEAIKKAARYCREHDILKEFLDEGNASEVMNMLMTEWNWDDALAVRYEEGMEVGIEKGIEEGMEVGIEKGMEVGIVTVARNALAQGLPIDVIHTITGLDKDAILKI